MDTLNKDKLNVRKTFKVERKHVSLPSDQEKRQPQMPGVESNLDTLFEDNEPQGSSNDYDMAKYKPLDAGKMQTFEKPKEASNEDEVDQFEESETE
jgi:hypothetical protein